jgi:hypothetical protein
MKLSSEVVLLTSDFVNVFCKEKNGKPDYYILSGQKCSVCGSLIEPGVAVVIHEWTRKKEYIGTIMHFDCHKQWVKHSISYRQERILVKVVPSRPPGSYLIIPKPVALATSRADACDDWMHLHKRRADSTTDRTVHSFNGESFEGALIGSPDAKEEIEAREKQEQFLLEANPEGYLQKIKENSQKAIADHKKFLLGK